MGGIMEFKILMTTTAESTSEEIMAILSPICAAIRATSPDDRR